MEILFNWLSTFSRCTCGSLIELQRQYPQPAAEACSRILARTHGLACSSSLISGTEPDRGSSSALASSRCISVRNIIVIQYIVIVASVDHGSGQTLTVVTAHGTHSISSALERLLTDDDADKPETEKYINAVAQTLRAALEKNPSSYTRKDVCDVLTFYEAFVQRSLEHLAAAASPSTTLSGPIPISPGPTLMLSHRRTTSATTEAPIPYPGTHPGSQPALSPHDCTALPAQLYMTFLDTCRTQISIEVLLPVINVHMQTQCAAPNCAHVWVYGCCQMPLCVRGPSHLPVWV
ncbi:hypothetical protein BU17DRAFT_61165 [Hysterangium stoloniferum]|nr:hypothetical protein BU17DRAFT_61165 [Hysterangium stoloniferum]